MPTHADEGTQAGARMEVAPLLLPPPGKFKRKFGFQEPGRAVLQKLDAPLERMRRNMHIHINAKTGKPGACTEPTGDAVALLIGYTAQECLDFSLSELIANVFDASFRCLAEAEMQPVQKDGKVGIECVLRSAGGVAEGVCGFVPTETGLVMWNLGTPFDESALIKGGNGPKATTSEGTGGFNFGLKQAANCLLALGIKPSIQFVGYDLSDRNASTLYTWARKPPKKIAGAFKQNPKQKTTFACNVPIVTTSTATVPGEGGIQPAEQHEAMARALSTFERVYAFDATAGATVVLADGAALVHRACYEPRAATFADQPIRLPEGPLVLVGERFYKVTLSGRGAQTWRDGMANLVIKCPGKGMPGMAYRAFVDEKRVVSNSLATDLLARIVQNVLRLEADPCAEEPVGRDERTRRALAKQLMPLLVGGVSELFGAARGAALEALIKHPDVSDAGLRKLLLGRALEPQREQLGLSREAMRAHIANSPIVHSGNVLRATYLASLCGTLAYKVDPSKVHRTLIATTNLAAAEERAAEAIWSADEREEPFAELAMLLEHLYGDNAEFAMLAMPENATLHGAARAFRFDDDEHGLHRLVLHKRRTPLDQVSEACALARPGTDEVARAQRVLDVRTKVWETEVGREVHAEACDDCDFIVEILKHVGVLDENGHAKPDTDDDDDDDASEPPAEDDDEPPDESPLPTSPPSEACSEDWSDHAESDDDVDGPVRRRAGGGGVRTEPSVRPLPPPPPPSPPPAGGFKDTVDFHADFAHGRCICHGLNTVKPTCVATEEPELTSTYQYCVELEPGVRIFVQMSPPVYLESIRSHPDWKRRMREYEAARARVLQTVGFGAAKVLPSWSPDGNWAGYADSKSKSIFINLTKLHATEGGNVETILHERAHIDVGSEHGHSLPWSERLHDLNAAFIDRTVGAGSS